MNKQLRLKNIIFDLDDTLIPSSQLYPLALVATLGNDLHWEKSYNEARDYIKGTLPPNHPSARNRLLYFKAYLELRNDNRRNALDIYNAYEFCLSEGIMKWVKQNSRLELLESLAQEFNLFILTNENTRTQLAKLKAITNSSSNIFKGILTSEEAGCEKPSDVIFKLLLTRYQLNPDNCVYVGDDITNDMIPAEKIGLQTILTREFSNANTLNYKIITHLNDLKGLLS